MSNLHRSQLIAPIMTSGHMLECAGRRRNTVRTPMLAVVMAVLFFIFVGLFLSGDAGPAPEAVQTAHAGLNADPKWHLPALPAEQLRFVAASERPDVFVARGQRYSVLLKGAEATLMAAAPTDATVRMRFIGAEGSSITVRGRKPLLGRIHSLKGRDAGAWLTGLHSFAEVIAERVYPGIDVLYKSRAGRLEYDLLLAPGTDPSQIQLQFEGVTGLALTRRGDLQLDTSFGLLRQPKPVIYQMDGSRRVVIDGGYRLLAGNRVGFEVHGYRSDQPLVIDPVLDVATTLGGNEADSGHAIAIDQAGYLYIAGITRSPDFPTEDAIQPDLNGAWDLFIAKLSADGSSLVYLTYLGGSAVDGTIGGESRLALAVDPFGQIVIAGATASKDFPLVTPLQPDYGGGRDGFVAKLSADGSRLLFSTLLGGSDDDAITTVAIDPQGAIYAAGHTRSDDFPTRNPLQPAIAGKQDAFVVKLSGDGRQLIQATYLGGSGKDQATAIAVDENGAAYITGWTQSSNDFPVIHAQQAEFGGIQDAFIAKLATDGSAWQWVSYLGGAGDERAHGLAVDQADRILVCGETGSKDFPVRNPLQAQLNGKSDGFIARFLDDGSKDYATWLGGAKKDRFSAIAVDQWNRFYVTGDSHSDDFPLIEPLQAQHQGEADIVIARLSQDSGQLQFASLLGGNKDDVGDALAVDQRGAVYLTGSTRSRLDFPEVSPLQPGFQGVQDAFIVRIMPDNRPPQITSQPITVGRVGRLYQYPVSAQDEDLDVLRYRLLEAPQGMLIDPDNGRIEWTPDTAGSFSVTLNVSDDQGGADNQTFDLQIDANRRPVIHSEPVDAGTAGQAFRYAVEASDPDGDPLHYQLATAPAGMTIDGSSGVIDWLPELAGQYPVTVAVRDDDQALAEQRFTVTIVRLNQAPALEPVAPQSVALGTTLTIQLSADDADGDPLTFSAAPLPLPHGAGFDAATGLFRFRPEHAGVHELTFLVSDGYDSDQHTVTLTVTQPDEGADTTFSGRVLDANDAAEGLTTPIVGAVVSFLGTGGSAVTDAQGYFSLTQLPGGEQVFDINPQTDPNGDPYAGFRERYTLAEQADNIEARPFYLPRIATGSLTTVDPNHSTQVRNDSLDITLAVPPHTAKNPDGSDFTGQLSISPVPRDLAPAPLPEFLDPGLLITIQPVGVTFATPLPITFPNTDDLPPGSEVDIWSLDPDAGAFTVVASGRVSDDGQTIETIAGGIRAADWHAAMPPKTDAAAQSDAAHCGCGDSSDVGSRVNTRSGWLSTGFTLPAYYSLDRAQALRFVYRSDTAWPQPVIPFDLTIPVRAAVPPKLSYRATLGGVDLARESFVHTQGLNENQDETLRGAVRLDGANLITGVYPATIRLTSHYQRSRIASFIEDTVTVVNAEKSPFGAGWGIAGLSRLVVNRDGSVLIHDGGGAVSRFAPVAESVAEVFSDDFEEGASANWSDRTTAEAGAFTQFLGRFSLAGSEPNSTSLNLDNLPEHKAVLLHFDFYAIDSLDGDNLKYGPDWFRIGTETHTANVFNETFTVFQSPQSYNVTQPQISDQNIGFTPHWPDAIYRRLNNGWVIPHSADWLRLNFSGITPQAEPIVSESWGIDNVRIELLSRTFGLSDATISGDVKPIAPLPSVEQGQYEDNDEIQVFNERHLFPMPADLAVDISRPGLYADGDNLTPETILAGMLVNSYFVHADPVGASQQQQQGTITFDREVIGIIGTAGTLNASNGAYGVPGITYPADSGAGLELGDSVTLSADRRSVTIDFTNSSDFDQLRILTRADGIGSSNRFANAKGDFSSLTRDDDGGYTRTLVDGTRVRFNTDGLQTEVVDRNGNTTTYVYQDLRLARIIDPLGQATVFTYQQDRLESVTDPGDRTTRIEYDPATGDLTRVIFADGSSQSFGYNERHLMTSQTDARGFTTSREYDDTGRLVRTHQPDGTTREAAALVSAGLAESGTSDQPAAPARPDAAQSRFTDGAGHSILMRTDRFGHLTERTDANGLTGRIERNADGLPERSVRPDQSAIVRGFNQAGRVISETEQFNDATTTYSYDGAYQLITSMTDPLGHITTFQRDSHGNVKRVVNALAHPIDLTYTDSGLIETITDPNGVVTAYTYTPQGLVETLTETPPQDGGPLRQTHFNYDPAGQLSRIITPDAIALDLTYDPLGRLTRIEDPLGQRVDYQYDAAGNRIGTDISDSDGTLVATVAQTFDALGRLTQLTRPHKEGLDSLDRFDYDGAGNPTSHNDPNGNSTDFSYDPGDRIQETIDALAGATLYRYDDENNGDLKTITAPNGATTEYNTDSLGRRLSETGPDRGSIDYSYDKNDNLTALTDARGLTVEYDYDPLDRLIAIHYPNTVEDVQLGYDACPFGIGRLCRISDQSGVTDYSYDAYGNITRVDYTVQGISYTQTYSYDAGHDLVAATLPSGRAVSYRYDSLKRLQAIDTTLNGQLEAIVDSISYQADGRLTGRRFGNGLTETRSYDLQGRLQLQDLGTQTAYDYDANGNMLQRAGHTDQSYRYDALNRLHGETNSSQWQDYGYDPNGNRQTKTSEQGAIDYTYPDNSNRLGAVGQDDLSYDAAGHLTKDAHGRILTYNQAGRLTTVTNDGIELARYTYNTNGQRIVKTTPAGTVVYHYGLAGRLIGETTQDGTPIRDYLWHELTPIAQIDIGETAETPLYLHTDHLATPRLATNAAGQTVWRWDSDAFGAVPADEDVDGNGIATRVNLRFPGQYFDQETGLFYNWFRYYDPAIGRYITSDPIGLTGGLNTYSYALEDPIIGIDPFGLSALFDVQVSFGGQVGVSGRIGPLKVKSDINVGAVDQSFSNPSGSVSQSFALTGTVGPLTLGPQVSRTAIGMPVRGRTSIISMLRGREFHGNFLFNIASKNKSAIKTTQPFNDFGSGDFVLGLGVKALIGIESKINLSELGRQLGQAIAELELQLQSCK